MHGCLFDDGYFNVLYATGFLDGGNNCLMLLSLQGGGLYLDSSSSATITGSTISYNSAVSFIDQ